MKKFYLLLLLIPFVFLFYFLVSGFTEYPEKTQINSDQDLRGYFVDAKNGNDENSGKQLSSPWKKRSVESFVIYVSNVFSFGIFFRRWQFCVFYNNFLHNRILSWGRFNNTTIHSG